MSEMEKDVRFCQLGNRDAIVSLHNKVYFHTTTNDIICHDHKVDSASLKHF